MEGICFSIPWKPFRRRPLSARALDWAFRGGLAVILALLVFTTINDLGSLGLMGPASALDWLGRLGQGTITGAGGGARRGTNCTKGGDG